MPREPERERTLDDEGVPDLEAPLPGKAATGDPQEGMPPPNEQPHGAVDHGITVDEQREPELLDERLAREESDVDGAPGAEAREEMQFPDPQGTGPDEEKELVAEDVPAEGSAAPEERAMHEQRD